MESKAIARFARIAPRKARVIVNLVRGQKVAQALDVLTFTRKSGAPIIKKLIESAIANAKQANASVDVDQLFVTAGQVDKGPNKHVRRWRPRAMGRATQIVKGVSHIQIVLTDTAPVKKTRRAKPEATESKAE
jgi:large subunit ribosomal protein L22